MPGHQGHRERKIDPDLHSFAIVDANVYYIEHGNNIYLQNIDWSSDYTSKEILAVSGNAVVLIRNPLEALYEYRDLSYGTQAVKQLLTIFLTKVLQTVQ